MTIPSALSQKPTQKTTSSATQQTEKRKYQRKGRDISGNDCTRCCIGLVGIFIAGFGVAAVVLYRQYGMDVNFHTYHDGDQVLASQTAKDLNSVLCQAYIVSTGSNRASIFLTDGPAQMSPDQRETINLRNTGLNADDEFDFRAFYLLPGSTIDVMACMSVFNRQPRIEAEVLFIKGDKHLSRWKGDSSCGHCIKHRVPVPADVLCELGGGVLARYEIHDADTYYIVVSRQHRADDDVTFNADVDIKVTKTLFDTSRAKQQCLRTSTCRLNLTYNAHDDVIVQFPSLSASSSGFVTFFTTDCELRRFFWLPVFVVAPGALLAVLIVLCVADCLLAGGNKKRRDEKKEAAKKVFTLHDQQESKPESFRDTIPLV